MAGTTVGLAAVLGRNHGLYGVVAGTGAIIYAYWGSSWREAGQAVAWSVVGVIVGYLPNLAMFMLVPGYAPAFLNDIILLFQTGYTNLPLPVPWPWKASIGSASIADTLRVVTVGVLFMALPLFGVCGLIYAVYLQRRRSRGELAVFAAAVLLCIPYVHYAYSRPDIEHLSFAVFPLLIGLLVLPLARPLVRFTVLSVLLGASVFIMAPFYSGSRGAREGNWREISIGHDVLTVHPSTAEEVNLLERLASRYACDNRSFLATPFWPGAYAVLQRKSPVWEIYALFPRSAAFQEQEITRIKAADPGFVVIMDITIDGREELRYKNSHPLIERFIRDNFTPVSDLKAPSYLQIYAKDDAAQKCS
jgi:hypothetical protein